MKRYWLIWGLLFSMPVMAEDIREEAFLYDDASVIQSVEQPPKITYVWADFLQGKSCADDFNHLQQLPFLTQKEQALRDKMQTYCINQKQKVVWSDLLNTFRQCKKNLLINKILKENDVFIGYIKAAPYYLFDIHNTNPNDNTLTGKLDLIQNAIQNKEPEKILIKMQELSPSDQLYLSAVFNDASSLVDFQKALQGE